MSIVLQTTNIKKSYGDLQILKGVDLTLPQSRRISIQGPSGSGKSTLLNILCLLDTFDSGYLTILDQKVQSWDKSKRNLFRGKHIGVVFQEFHLIPSLTAKENILLPLQLLNIKEDKQWQEELWNRLGLEERLTHLPEALSGGEQQRAAIARALIHKPSIILADEPTGSLDEENATIVENLFFDIIKSQGSALLLITHNPSLAQRCDEQKFIRHGLLVDNTSSEK